MNVEYKVIYNRKKKLNRNGKALVQIEAYLDGKRRYFSTEVCVSPGQWNPRPDKSKYVSDEESNAKICDRINSLRKFAVKHKVLNDDIFALSDFDLFAQPNKVQKPALTFNEFFEQQLKIEQKNLEYSTWQQQGTNYRLFKQFAGEKVKFEDLNFALIQGYDGFLKNRNLRQNTVEKRHRQLRKYINLAIKHEHLAENKNPYRLFKPQTEKVATDYLRKEELVKLENLTFSCSEVLLEKTRDMFLLGCYTSLRISDILNIKAENLTEGEKGLTLRLMVKKTKKEYEAELFNLWAGKAQPILRKYLRSDGKRLFHGVTSQKANKLLKELALRIGYSRNLHFHISRHTFGTHTVLKLPLHVVQELMQHSDIKTTMIYLHLSKHDRNELLAKTDWN